MKRAAAVVNPAEEQAAYATAVETLRGLRDRWTATCDANDRAKLVKEATGNLVIVKLVDPVQADVYLAEIANVAGITKGSLRGMVGKSSRFWKDSAAGAGKVSTSASRPAPDAFTAAASLAWKPSSGGSP